MLMLASAQRPYAVSHSSSLPPMRSMVTCTRIGPPPSPVTACAGRPSIRSANSLAASTEFLPAMASCTMALAKSSMNLRRFLSFGIVSNSAFS